MSETEELLIQKIKEGDEIAFKIIYNKYFSRLYFFVLEFVSFDDLAENIVQDTFFTVWNKRRDLDPKRCFGAFLYTMARNNCLYRLRDQRYRQKLFDSGAIGVAELEVNAEVLTSLDASSFTMDEIERIIRETLEQLPPQCQRVFRLSRFEGRKNREIAEELNISEKIVEKHISKALKIYRVALKDYLPLVAYLFH